MVAISERLFTGLCLAFAVPESWASAGSGARSNDPPSKAVVFRTLFDEYFPKVRSHVASFIEDEEEVNEITAEVFVAAWRKLHPAKPMGASWFLRVASNKVRDANRRSRSKARALAAVTRGAESGHEGLDPLDLLAVKEALETLNARERQVIILTYWDGLTAGEVADVLRASTASVWATLTRARKKLRAQLNSKGA